MIFSTMMDKARTVVASLKEAAASTIEAVSSNSNLSKVEGKGVVSAISRFARVVASIGFNIVAVGVRVAVMGSALFGALAVARALTGFVFGRAQRVIDATATETEAATA